MHFFLESEGRYCHWTKCDDEYGWEKNNITNKKKLLPVKWLQSKRMLAAYLILGLVFRLLLPVPFFFKRRLGQLWISWQFPVTVSKPEAPLIETPACLASVTPSTGRAGLLCGCGRLAVSDGEGGLTSVEQVAVAWQPAPTTPFSRTALLRSSRLDQLVWWWTLLLLVAP